MLHLSTIRFHYDMGFRSVVSLVEELEQQIESLALAQESPSHLNYLEQTIFAQQNEIERLRQTIENKSKHFLKTEQTNYRLQQKLQKRLDRARNLNRELRSRIRELEEFIISDHPSTPQHDSHNSSLPPSLDLPWQKPKRTRSLRKKTGKQIGGQMGHQGFTLRQVSDPDLVIVHQLNVCQHCHHSLIGTDSTRFLKRHIFEIENGRLTIIEHQAQVKLCPLCRKISKAYFPDNLKAPVQYGSSVFSRIVYLNYYQLLPVARTAESMNDLFACPVSWATINRATKFCSDKLLRDELKIKARFRDSSFLGVDETGIRINGEIAWVHVARTDDLTHLAPHAKRGKAAIDEIGIINQFAGVLVRDGFLSYQHYEQCQHSMCNAHLLRNLTFVSENEPKQKKWTIQLIELLLKIKNVVSTTRLQAKTQLEESLLTNFNNRYDGIIAEAEKAIRGSPKRKDLLLSAQSLHRRRS